MQLILDNLAATIIFTAVALAVATTQLYSSRSSVESTVSYMAKKQTLDLASVLEQELKMIGEGTANDIDLIQTNADGQTTRFVFWRNDGVNDLKIEYRLVATDTVEINDTDVPRYRMDRYVNDIQDGGSSPTLRDFRIEALDEAGNVVGAASAVLVRASILDTYPIGELDDMYLGQTYWGITLRPENL